MTTLKWGYLELSDFKRELRIYVKGGYEDYWVIKDITPKEARKLGRTVKERTGSLERERTDR